MKFIEELLFEFINEIINEHHEIGGSGCEECHVKVCEEDIQELVLYSQPQQRFFQLNVLTQGESSDSCGYYAYYNAVVLYHAFHFPSPKSLSLLRSHVSYWKHFSKLKQKLLNKAESEGNKGWPWSHKSINEGIMERSYLNHLVLVENSYFPSSICSTIQFGFGNLMLPPTQIIELNNVFEKIRKMENGSHIFFLGILTHWTCLVITKENHQSSLFYMDSMNRPSLIETDETIEKWLLEEEAQREKKGKKKLRDDQVVLYKQSRIDAKLLLNLIVNFVEGESVIKSYFNENVSKFLKSYEQHVGSFNIDTNLVCDMYIAKLLNWLDNYWNPSIIRDSIFHELKLFGVNTLTQENFENFLTWCQFQMSPQLQDYPLGNLSSSMYEILSKDIPSKM